MHNENRGYDFHNKEGAPGMTGAVCYLHGITNTEFQSGKLIGFQLFHAGTLSDEV